MQNIFKKVSTTSKQICGKPLCPLSWLPPRQEKKAKNKKQRGRRMCNFLLLESGWVSNLNA
jgi:hypothetical protein